MVDSPRALYGMQDASGNPQDSSGNGLHMTSIAAAADYQQEGAIDDFSIRLIGGETMARSTHISTVTDNFTMVLLVDVQAVTANDQIIFYNGNSGANGYGIVVDADGQFQYLAGGVALGGLSGAILEARGHILIHVVRRAGVWEYYTDGRVQVANAGNTAPGTPSGTLTLGGGSIQTAYGLAAFYETALSAARIKAHYRAMDRAFVRDAIGTAGGTTTTNNIVLDLPADIENGDMLIAHFVASEPGTITPPDSTWKRLPRCYGHPGHTTVDSTRWGYYKRADGTESGTVTFTKSGTNAYYAGIIMSVGAINWDFPIGFVRTTDRTGDATTNGLSTPFKGALALQLAAYDTSVDVNESAAVAWTGTNGPHYKREAFANQKNGASAVNYGIWVAADYIDMATRDMDASAPGAVTIDVSVAGTEYSTWEITINSKAHALSKIEFLWASSSASSGSSTPSIIVGSGTTEGVTVFSRVLLPGMYVWGFLAIHAGETVTLTNWELRRSAREFVNVAGSPFNNSEAADRLRLHVGYLTVLTEDDCWYGQETGNDDDFIGTFDASRAWSYGVMTFAGPNLENVVFPDGTFEETIVNSTAPDQTAMTITHNDAIVILIDAVQASASGITAPTGYTERFEAPTGTTSNKMAGATKSGVPVGTEDPGAWTTPSGRHVLWKNFQSSEPDQIFPQIVFIQS